MDQQNDKDNSLSTRFRLRETSAYVQSEKLELTEESVIMPPIGDYKSIVLDSMVDGLNIGQLVSNLWPTRNEPGVHKNEIAVLSDIIHFKDGPTFTTLIFTQNLLYRYRPDTVIINANVTRATHGETKHEVVGSGGQSLAEQSQPQQAQIRAKTKASDLYLCTNEQRH